MRLPPVALACSVAAILVLPGVPRKARTAIAFVGD
jgi:hypothetical protein